ncbi:bifunctional transcriptional activator/DNA repair enzyme AdaA [Paenibacillus paeoniae]|uniref:Helix-turn-helix domain-containing protein n=1 Tax=Paenibacillus paeoniae TaxID=2292705 RepID=A0A371PKD4_9BACL|nr:Ada metal-binding domain-containing protein [Paenibacillus paeoniae]REK76644.1 helix-turn-helix domain-containing protein [Paenibacillus paeoniae]
MIQLSFEEMWERIIECDSKYDGLFYTAVKTTSIYCRPSCRSRKPKKENVTFYSRMVDAEEAGYRACKRCRPESEHSPNVAVVRQVKEFLVQHHKQKVELKDIAVHVGLSAFHLERLFKQDTTVTPRAFLEKVRIDRAAHLLLHTGLSNLDICYEAGFHSPSNFYKVFRQAKGLTPSDYRKTIQPKEENQTQ